MESLHKIEIYCKKGEQKVKQCVDVKHKHRFGDTWKQLMRKKGVGWRRVACDLETAPLYFSVPSVPVIFKTDPQSTDAEIKLPGSAETFR